MKARRPGQTGGKHRSTELTASPPGSKRVQYLRHKVVNVEMPPSSGFASRFFADKTDVPPPYSCLSASYWIARTVLQARSCRSPHGQVCPAFPGARRSPAFVRADDAGHK